MSDVTMPSWRVRPQEKGGWGIPPRAWMIGGGLLGAVALAAGIIWAVSAMGPRGVPVIEADGRPFKVRPDSPGGAVVPNQGELVFERGAARNERPTEARLAPGPEAPRPDALRAQGQAAASPPSPSASAAIAPPRAPAPLAPVAQQAPPARPAAGGRVQVQLVAARSEEAARGEWDRLSRRAPELAGRTPAISRFDRPEGQAPLFRLRTGGFADRAAAATFCDQLKARDVACVLVGG